MTVSDKRPYNDLRGFDFIDEMVAQTGIEPLPTTDVSRGGLLEKSREVARNRPAAD
jgi:hypothetical protein